MAEMTPQDIEQMMQALDAQQRDRLTGRMPTLPQTTDSLRASPNQLAAALMKYGPMPAQLATELSGIPSMARGGSAIGTGLAQGDAAGVVGGMGEAALGMVPAASQNAALARALLSSAPRTAATLGVAGAATAVPEAAEAQTRKNARTTPAAPQLTENQVRKLQMEQTRTDRELAAERQRNMDAIEAQKAQAAAEIETQKARDTAATEAKQAEAAMPIRERYPWVGPAATGAGYALAGAAPALVKAMSNLKTYGSRSVPSRLDEAIAEAEAIVQKKGQLSAPDKATASMRASEIDNLLAKSASEKRSAMVKDNVTTPVAGGFLASEGRIIPDQFDLANPNLSDENRGKAKENIGDLQQLLATALLGSLTGWSSTKISGGLTPSKAPDLEGGAAARDAALRASRRR